MGTMEGSKVPSTTTISTIAVQSGSSRLVLAVLQSGTRQRPRLQLRLLEMFPEFGWLGSTTSEAGSLQAGQVKVMAALQDKQSPVEELLRQADQMILTQQPRAEVYSAMAESLGSAWRDINNIMEERKIILDINLAFQGHLQVRSWEEMLARNSNNFPRTFSLDLTSCSTAVCLQRNPSTLQRL